MAIEASFVATEGEFPLAEVFAKFPAGRIELDRVVPTNKVLVPYFWLENADESEITMSGIEHPGIEDLRVIDDVDGKVFVRIDWNFEYEGILTAILETNVSLVSAIGKEERWTFELRGTKQHDISEFQTYCRERDIPVELTQLHALSPIRNKSDLTDTQREALILAYARGYYDSPREASQEEIAEELGITRQAVASRLQRGTRRLIAGSIVESAE
ncbi:Predicted DNA binding protein, contains HTH domain [Natronorubrum sediminis]|uniref:Predicted DNA binding protein, contains HTH domain n=1 Tax=Natronorubrum sediminis TaxID=640943 RepID=A0A1H6G3R2_9EURY|nr:helix-turn-helix domain-containing protein [Natronorubrum sediminis]SEH16525.1 Predicted DNA binding protein, contains HTH domain [Natronorubrum sediminis]